MAGFRMVILRGACVVSVLSTGIVSAAAAPQHAKSAKQCNDELKANAAAIEASGESASAFFHACWWRTAPGEKTPIEASAKSAPGAAKQEQAAALEQKASHTQAPETGHRATRRFSSARARRQEQRSGRAHRLPRSEEPDEAVAEPAAAVVDTSRVAPQATSILSAPAAGIESVPVTVAGVPNAVVLPVLPGYTPLVRELLNHPAVPGLTAAP